MLLYLNQENRRIHSYVVARRRTSADTVLALGASEQSPGQIADHYMK